MFSVLQLQIFQNLHCVKLNAAGAALPATWLFTRILSFCCQITLLCHFGLMARDIGSFCWVSHCSIIRLSWSCSGESSRPEPGSHQAGKGFTPPDVVLFQIVCNHLNNAPGLFSRCSRAICILYRNRREITLTQHCDTEFLGSIVFGR